MCLLGNFFGAKIRIELVFIILKRIADQITGGGVRGEGGRVRKPQNRTEIRQKTANRIGFFPNTETARTWKPTTWKLTFKHTIITIMVYCTTLFSTVFTTKRKSAKYVGHVLGSRLQNNGLPTVLKSVINAHTFFQRKPRPKGCNNRKR